MVESCRSLPKAGYGSKLLSLGRSLSLFCCAERTCSTHAVRAEPQPRALLVVAEDRVERSTVVSRCHPATSYSLPASIPAAGSHSSCAVSCPHKAHFGHMEADFLGSQLCIPMLAKGGRKGTEDGAGDKRQTSHDCPCAGWGLTALHAAFLLSSHSHKQ